MKLNLGLLLSEITDQSGSSQQMSATVLFATTDSSRLIGKYGDQRGQQLAMRGLNKIAVQVDACSGVIVKTVGDEIMSCFPNPERAVFAACEMHRTVKDDPSLIGLNIPIKIGLHHGPVVVVDDQVFGDAVTIATRMLALAKADQIITSQETAVLLPSGFEAMVRNLGPSWAPGREGEMEIVEMLWRDSISQTQVVSYQDALMKLLFARLFLEYRGKSIELVPDHQVFKIGRGGGNDLVVGREQVSRSHAVIEFRQGKFILVDQSANGTHVLLENGARIFLRREEFTLHDRGLIFLGSVISEQDPDGIHYSVIQNAQEVYAREHELKKQKLEIHVEVDPVDCAKRVTEIVESDYFKRINALANRLRTGRSQ